MQQTTFEEVPIVATVSDMVGRRFIVYGIAMLVLIFAVQGLLAEGREANHHTLGASKRRF